jgi:hypothetical protein
VFAHLVALLQLEQHLGLAFEVDVGLTGDIDDNTVDDPAGEGVGGSPG